MPLVAVACLVSVLPAGAAPAALGKPPRACGIVNGQFEFDVSTTCLIQGRYVAFTLTPKEVKVGGVVTAEAKISVGGGGAYDFVVAFDWSALAQAIGRPVASCPAVRATAPRGGAGIDRRVVCRFQATVATGGWKTVQLSYGTTQGPAFSRDYYATVTSTPTHTRRRRSLPGSRGGTGTPTTVCPPAHPSTGDCIPVPRDAIRPPGVSEQGGPTTPSDPPAAAGERGRGAMEWALARKGARGWTNYCEGFVEKAYGTSGGFPTAAKLAASLKLRPGSAPAGALVFFRADWANNNWGHVGISLGDGRMVSALSNVEITDISKPGYWKHQYVGWSYAPASWPGRAPRP